MKFINAHMSANAESEEQGGKYLGDEKAY